MADGVPIATTLYLPVGAAPASGWPAMMFLHGLGGQRGDLRRSSSPIAATGYAVLTYDARGHGQSGGTVGLDGPAEISDVRALFARLAARPDVDDAHIGAWGISLRRRRDPARGRRGRPVRRARAERYLERPVRRAVPQDLAKSGVVFQFVNEITRPSEPITAVQDDALQGRDLAALRTFPDARSSRSGSRRSARRRFWFQGKRDFAFGMEQAIDGYARLAGPKRLYLGNLGHAPSTFAADDLSYFLAQGRPVVRPLAQGDAERDRHRRRRWSSRRRRSRRAASGATRGCRRRATTS